MAGLQDSPSSTTRSTATEDSDVGGLLKNNVQIYLKALLYHYCRRMGNRPYVPLIIPAVGKESCVLPCGRGKGFCAGNSTASFPSTQCLDCKAKWEGSQLIDVMRNIRWEQLEEMVSVFQQYCFQNHPWLLIIMKDERLLLLGTALRGARAENFAKGQSNCLVYKLVHLVRQYGLCQPHLLQLDV